ncbi:MAG: hemerythrin domain-containing protein [Gemmatimonadota bacterium]|nr:hemerythrin domain-containing protein [Gemmatimonadota bacterium]
MKRDPRLRGLSSDHHQALVLARRVGHRAEAGTLDMDLARDVAERFRDELEPHFGVEEEVLLPALRDLGENELPDRTLDDHAFLRQRVRAAEDGDAEALADFAERLHDHVRFEERTLFPACEARLPDAVLEEAARRAPKE